MESKRRVRLNKFLAERAGISRRQAEQAIKKGMVFVNNQKTLSLAVFVDPQKDLIRWKKKLIPFGKKASVYFMLNKPEKTLSTTKDPKGRPTVMNYIRKTSVRLFPVGRLDWDSEGLLILTNDGDFSAKALHPKVGIPKTYLVKLKASPKDSQLKKLIQGVSTAVGKRRALFVGKISGKTASNPWVKIIIAEGKKRQIRLMFDKIGFPVQKLRRTAIGRLKMNKLAKGAVVQLNERDIQKVFQWPKELRSFRGRRKIRPPIKKALSKNQSSKKSP